MKLNFWQWLAIGLLIIGCVVWFFERTHTTVTPPTHSAEPATTQPVVAP